MRLKVRELRALIQDMLSEAYTLGDNVTLYHRSNKKFKVGDILTPQVETNGEHWMASHGIEKALERARKESYPDLPSRLSCVYASLVPRSRFINKGHLYAIEPIGPAFVTDANIIDQLARENPPRGPDYSPSRVWVNPADYTIQRYWKGVDPGRENVGHLEVLMKSARVVAVLDDKRLRQGEHVTLSFPVNGYINVFKGSVYVGSIDKVRVEEVLDLINTDSRLQLVSVDDEGIEVLLAKGATFKIARGRYGSPKETDPGEFSSSPPNVTLEMEPEGLHISIETKDCARLAKSVASGETKVG